MNTRWRLTGNVQREMGLLGTTKEQVGRTGGQAVQWFHRDYQGQLTTPHWLWAYSGFQHMYSPQSEEREHVLPAWKVLFTPRMCHLSQIGHPLLLFHPCDHSVTMETRLLPCIPANLKLWSPHSVFQSSFMTWIVDKALQHLFTWGQLICCSWF